MQQRSLGNEGLKVSALGLGCMAMTPLYDKPDPNEAARTIDAAIDGGVTMIDTADAYNDGKNEELVGRALAGRRDRVVLATKFGNVRLPDGTRTVDARPEHAVEACEKSLKRLGVEVIDLFYLHRMRSEEHTSELQSLMRISYAVFCLKKKTKIQTSHF